MERIFEVRNWNVGSSSTCLSLVTPSTWSLQHGLTQLFKGLFEFLSNDHVNAMLHFINVLLHASNTLLHRLFHTMLGKQLLHNISKNCQWCPYIDQQIQAKLMEPTPVSAHSVGLWPVFSWVSPFPEWNAYQGFVSKQNKNKTNNQTKTTSAKTHAPMRPIAWERSDAKNIIATHIRSGINVKPTCHLNIFATIGTTMIVYNCSNNINLYVNIRSRKKIDFLT